LQAPALQGRSRTLAWCALYGVLSAAFCAPLFAQPLALGVNDWDQHLFYYGSVLKNVIEYGQMPYWNPWYCGGNVMWQNPQIALLSPVYPLAAMMPLQLAMKINIVLHYWIGFFGMHVLVTRILGITFAPAVIYLATLVTASGAPAIHLRVGHSVFLPGFYLPLQLYFFFRAFQTGSWKYIFLSAATLALMVFNGGTHILPMSIASLGTFSLCAAIARRDWRPLAFAIAFGVAALAYSAPKLLPIVQYVNGEFFWDTRNPTERPDLVTLDVLKQMYLVPTQDVRERLPMQRHGWHEYGNYIGPGSAFAIVCGFVWVLVRRSRADHWFGVSLAVTAAFLFLLSLGEFATYAPANLAHQVPLFSSFRIPSRYTIPFLQFAALTLAWVFQSAISHYGLPQIARVAVAVTALAASAHLIYVNQWNLRRVFTEAPFDTSFHWMSGPRQLNTLAEASPYAPGSPMLRALMEDRSFYTCYESLQVARGAGPDRPPVFDANPGDRVRDLDFSPNELTFSVNEGAGEARVILNQNWAPGWTSTAGALATPPPTELASFVVPAKQSGRHTLRFRPPLLVTGLAIFDLALIVTLTMWRRRSRPLIS
jgi:multisubunit Na+/H+ antiporter MnhC subunit